VRRAIRQSQASIAALAGRYDLTPKTVAKWKQRTQVHDVPVGPKPPRSTVLTLEEEALMVAFRQHALLPLDDCLYALQATLPHITRSALHRCPQRHGISRLPEMAGEPPAKQPFKSYPIGDFHLDIAEVRPEDRQV
jgi:transposase-like protein